MSFFNRPYHEGEEGATANPRDRANCVDPPHDQRDPISKSYLFKHLLIMPIVFGE